jgi:hypothetical protein
VHQQLGVRFKRLAAASALMDINRWRDGLQRLALVNPHVRGEVVQASELDAAAALPLDLVLVLRQECAERLRAVCAFSDHGAFDASRHAAAGLLLSMRGAHVHQWAGRVLESEAAAIWAFFFLPVKMSSALIAEHSRLGFVSRVAVRQMR